MNWLRCILVLTGLLLTGCTLVAPTPSLPTPMRPPELSSIPEALQAAIDGKLSPGAVTITYDIGNKAWDGRTTLVARGDGSVQVTFARGSQHDQWQGNLSDKEFSEMLQILLTHEIWAIRGQRETGVPDEAYPTVRVEVEGFDAVEAGMWLGEAQEHPHFGPIVQRMAQLALEISGGVAK